MLVLEERWKPQYLEENLSEQGREPTYSQESNPGHIGEKHTCHYFQCFVKDLLIQTLFQAACSTGYKCPQNENVKHRNPKIYLTVCFYASEIVLFCGKLTRVVRIHKKTKQYQGLV